MGEPAADGGLGWRGLLALVARVCAARWRALLLAGLLIFIPLGVIDVFGFNELELDDDADAMTVITGLLGLGLGVTAALVGDVVYAGVVAGLVAAERQGRDPSIVELARRLPLAKLATVDLLAALLIAAGFIALVAPGLLFLAWFALVAPAVEVEKRGITAAFGRSRELVRGHAWLVLAVLVPLLIAEAPASAAARSASSAALGDGFAGEWLGAVLGNLVTSPFYAAAVSVLFFELCRLNRAARSSPGTPPR